MVMAVMAMRDDPSEVPGGNAHGKDRKARNENALLARSLGTRENKERNGKKELKSTACPWRSWSF